MTNSAASPTRRARFVRNPTDRTDYPLHHIPQGLAILQTCDELSFATNGQITRLLFANGENRFGQKRTYRAAERSASISLQRLWRSGFLDRRPIMLTSKRSGIGYHHFVNVVTAHGATELRRHINAEGTGELRWKRNRIKISNQTIEHSLAINDFHILAKRAASDAGIGFHEWRDDRQLTAMQNHHQLNLVSIPDAFFVLSMGGRFFGHFLEMDTGSVTVVGHRSLRSWIRTIGDYGQYFRDHYPNDGYFRGFTAPIVLTVTSTEIRMQHLLQATKQARGAGVYWYTTVDRIAVLTSVEGNSSSEPCFDPSVLWRPIWDVVNDSRPRSLLDRLSREPA